jgi:hypothetical protein
MISTNAPSGSLWLASRHRSCRPQKPVSHPTTWSKPRQPWLNQGRLPRHISRHAKKHSDAEFRPRNPPRGPPPGSTTPAAARGRLGDPLEARSSAPPPPAPAPAPTRLARGRSPLAGGAPPIAPAPARLAPGCRIALPDAERELARVAAARGLRPAEARGSNSRGPARAAPTRRGTKS